MTEYADYIVPFVNDTIDGCGFFVGDYFITAGHLFDKTNSLDFYFRGNRYTITKEDAIFLKSNTDNLNSEEVQDIAIFKFKDIGSPLKLCGLIPYYNSQMSSYSFIHSNYDNPNPYTIVEVYGEVRERLYHFFECEMHNILKPGSSGSPLISENIVYGILSGCMNPSEHPELILYCSTKDLPIL